MHLSWPCSWQAILPTLCCWMLAWGLATAEELPIWQALDGDTLAAVHVPADAQFRGPWQRSRLGALLAEERIIGEVLEVLAAHAPEAHAQIMAELGQAGLQPADLSASLAGPLGAAMAMHRDEAGDRHWQLLAWLSPGEELGQRLVAGLAAAVVAHEEAPDRRLRLEALVQEGQRLLVLRAPRIRTQPLEDDDAEGMLEDVVVEGPQPSLLLLASGSRLLVGLQMDGEQLQRPAQRLVDLARMAEAGEMGAFGRRVSVGDSLAGQLPAGPRGFEGYIDVAHLLRLLRQDMARGRRHLNPDEHAIFGYDAIGLMGLSTQMEAAGLKLTVTMDVAEPWRGIMGLFVQSPLVAQVPAWIPDTVIDAQGLSFDPLVALEHVLAMVDGFAGAAAQDVRDQVDLSLEMFVGTHLRGLCAAFGTEHLFLRLPRLAVQPEVEMKPLDPELDQAPAPQVEEEHSLEDWRFTWVQEVRDAIVVEAAITAVANLIGGWGAGEILMVEREGFRGWELDSGAHADPRSAGMYLRNKTLVSGVGVRDIDRILRAIGGDATAALRDSAAYQTMAQALPEEGLIYWHYQDLPQVVSNTFAMASGVSARFKMALRLALGSNLGAEIMELFAPEFDEAEVLAAWVGKSLGRLRRVPNGLIYHLIIETP
ncbi:MAG: hypothetical protein EA402_11725 [Planctomycetota bacterium]|nr:MAG: hypothetical protein EA402_11725 [Planctomycetota bacterium]